MYFHNRRPKEAPENAFTFTELLVILCIIALLCLIVLPVLARDTDSPERAVCLSNVRQIMTAVAMYATDNNDHLPHPSWGSDLTGADNWCYATHLPTGQPAFSAAGIGGPGAYTNQMPFYLAGQLARYVDSQRVLICPTDWRESMSTKASMYQFRAEKLSSYVMNGTVGGYVGPKHGRIPSGTTYKTSDFLPTDILLWEQKESYGFVFNDAGANPEDDGTGGITQRHAASTGEGVGTVGRAGATADFMKWGPFTNLQKFRGQSNDLLCGPGYQ